jgi:aspartyl/asparaginyl-tRNA synthetase
MMKTKQKLTPISHKQTEAKAEVIKLGIDVHHCKYVVVAQTGNETLRSPRSFTPEAFLAWGRQIYTEVAINALREVHTRTHPTARAE